MHAVCTHGYIYNITVQDLMSHSACINLYSLFSAIPEDGMKEEDRIEDSPDERISRECMKACRNKITTLTAIITCHNYSHLIKSINSHIHALMYFCSYITIHGLALVCSSITLQLFWYTEFMKDKYIQRDDEYYDSEDEGEDQKGASEHYEDSDPVKEKRARAAPHLSASGTVQPPPVPFHPHLETGLSLLNKTSVNVADQVEEMLSDAVLSPKLSTLPAALQALNTTSPAIEPPAKRSKM